MTRKKVYRLKPAVKVFLVIIVFCSLFIPVAWNKYQEYLYTKTNEYAFLQLGYSEDAVKLMLDKLNDEEEKAILTYQYNEFIQEFLKCKYYMF